MQADPDFDRICEALRAVMWVIDFLYSGYSSLLKDLLINQENVFLS